MNPEIFKKAERVLIPKGRDLKIVLEWIALQGFEPPMAPTEDRRSLHPAC